MTTVEERVSVLEAQMADTRGDVHAIFDELKLLSQRLVARPSWPVAAIITILSSTTVGLIVALATGAPH